MEKRLTFFYIVCLFLLVVGFFFDKSISNFFFICRNNFLIGVMQIFSFFGSWFFVLIFISLIFFVDFLKKRKKVWNFGKLLRGWSALFFSMFITFVLKILVARQRPEFALLESESFSFPSGHATAVFSGFAVVSEEFKKLGWWWLGFAVIVVFSRLYLGMHYLTDVVFGALVGYSVSLGLIRLFKTLNLKNKRKKKSLK